MIKMIVIILFGFLAVFFGCLSQKKQISITNDCSNVAANRYEFFSFFCLTISFFMLALPCFFCGEGTDLYIYVQLYENWTFADLKLLKFEPGYILLNIFLRCFFDNAYIGLGIIKVLSLFLVYKSLYMLRDRVNLGFSIFSYIILLYIYNYHLLRMSLAVGLVFLALSYEVCGKYKKAIIYLFISIFIHYTSVIVLFTFFIYKMFKKEMNIFKVTVLSLVLMLVHSSIIPIIQNIISKVPAFNKYTTYLDKASTDTGLVQIVLFIPILYILINCYEESKNDKFYILNVIFGIMLFFSGSLGYVIPVAGRSTYYFFWFAVTFFGTSLLINDNNVLVVGKARINFTTLAAVAYLALQVVITFVLNDAFASNGLTQYSLWCN